MSWVEVLGLNLPFFVGQVCKLEMDDVTHGFGLVEFSLVPSFEVKVKGDSNCE